MRNDRRIAASACVIAVLLGSDRIVLAQAGSTGGFIGKSDKSISGGHDVSEPRGQPSPTNKKAGHVASSLSGRWGWEAGCPVNRYVGDLQLTELSRGQLTGEFVHDSGTVRGGRISGSVHGNEVSFSRDNGERRLQYKSVLESPMKMNGSVSVEGIVCNFTAAKR
jgi:hypothetical protein